MGWRRSQQSRRRQRGNGAVCKSPSNADRIVQSRVVREPCVHVRGYSEIGLAAVVRTLVKHIRNLTRIRPTVGFIGIQARHVHTATADSFCIEQSVVDNSVVFVRDADGQAGRCSRCEIDGVGSTHADELLCLGGIVGHIS